MKEITASSPGGKEQLLEQGIFLLTDQIEASSVDEIITGLLSLHYKKSFQESVQIIINSSGGSCDAGWALIDIIDYIRLPVITVALGCIASMAHMIFIAGDRRIMSANTVAMQHHHWNIIGGSFPDLLAAQKGEQLEYNRGIKHLIRFSKYETETQIRKHILKDQDHWMSPKEMKKHGMCDIIVDPRQRNVKLPPKKKIF